MLSKTFASRLASANLLNTMPILSNLNQKRGIKLWKPEEPPENIQQPPKYKLPVVPTIPSQFLHPPVPPKGTHEQWRWYGEEKVHNQLVLGQYGIIAISAGTMSRKHFEFLRNKFNKYLEKESSFAILRIDAPYKPKTSKIGKRMGSGKGKVKSYVTPVKAGRVILEVGGKINWDETRPWLTRMAANMPMECIAVSAEQLERIKAEEKRLTEQNTNPYTIEWMIRNNILDCQSFLSPYDTKWFGKFTYRDRHNNKMWNNVLQSKYGRK